MGIVGDEPVDVRVSDWYRRLLEIVDAPVFHGGEWRLIYVAGGEAARDLAAWSWRGDVERRISCW